MSPDYTIWDQYHLLVTVNSKYGVLVCRATQEEVVEYIHKHVVRQVISLNVETLSEETYEIMRPHASYVVGE